MARVCETPGCSLHASVQVWSARLRTESRMTCPGCATEAVAAGVGRIHTPTRPPAAPVAVVVEPEPQLPRCARGNCAVAAVDGEVLCKRHLNQRRAQQQAKPRKRKMRSVRCCTYPGCRQPLTGGGCCAEHQIDVVYTHAPAEKP